jgi:hypothetical protein
MILLTDDPMKQAKEGLSIVVVLEDGLLFIAPGGNMVDGARVLYAKRASHDKTLACRENRCKLNRPDPQATVLSSEPELKLSLRQQ